MRCSGLTSCTSRSRTIPAAAGTALNSTGKTWLPCQCSEWAATPVLMQRMRTPANGRVGSSNGTMGTVKFALRVAPTPVSPLIRK